MKILFLGLTFFVCVGVKAQMTLSPGVGMYPQKTIPLDRNFNQDSLSSHKWFLSYYSGISTGISFSKFGNASFLSAPFGLQLNRKITDNLYGFANLSISPSYIYMNPFYISSGFHNDFGNAGLNRNVFGIYPAASMGLMYINDARTFSISGSITAEKNVYPLSPYYPSMQNKQNPVFLQHR